tara:strand:- start:720 stop:1541 length:822 start_codon:yes stop_codon:yes gene_type:complete
MVFRYLVRPSSGSSRSFDADTLLWRDAVVTNGGSVTLTRLVIVDQFVYDEKAAGLWTLTDDYLGFWAENAIQGLTSLKQRRLAVAVNSPTFTTDRNYVFNGTTNYVDTGFIPSTHAVAMATSSVHAEVYERTNISGTNASLGTNSGSNRAIATFPRDGSNVLVAANGLGAVYTLSPLTSAGLTQFGRNGATTADVYGAKNGVNLTQTSPHTALGASLPSVSFFVGGINLLGALNLPRAASVGYTAWGAALTSAQRLARYTNVQAWATSVGANV